MKQAYVDDCPYYLDDFLTNMKVVKDRSDRTEEAYFIDIRTFLRYLNVKHHAVPAETPFNKIKIKETPIEWLECFSLNDAYVYLKYLKDERNNSTKTRARKCSALKQFYVYLCQKAKIISNNPLDDLELPHINQALPKYLSLEQSLELLRNIDSKNQVRDYCIITLFLNCGMRLSELVGINVNDFVENIDPSQPDVKYLSVKVLGKGNKERIVYLNEQCVDAVTKYTEARKSVADPKEKALFISKRGNRITNRRVEQIIDDRLKACGLAGKGISVHKLRHTAATLMYQNGVDVRVLKEVLGHENLNTTQIYTHVVNTQLRDAINSNPVMDIKNDLPEPDLKQDKDKNNK